jgi:hypothetical protein
VDHIGAAKSAVAHPPECGTQALKLTGGRCEGRRGRGGHDGVGGALIGDGAAVKRPGDGGKAVVIEGTQWG